MLNRDDQILVAGAGGFVGGHLVRYLTRQGFTRIRAADIKPVPAWLLMPRQADCVQLDLRSQAAAAEAVAGCRYVFNLAAETGGAAFTGGHQALCMLSAAINATMLEAARDAGADRYFYSSSARLYPQDVFSERLCGQFLTDFGFQTRVARYQNVYGPHCPWQGGRERVAAALCRKVAEATLAGADEIEIWGDGKQARTFTHVEDCARASLMIMEGDQAEPVNVASTDVVSVDQLADLVEESAGVRLKRRYNLSQPAGARGPGGDHDLSHPASGWGPEVALRDGIAGTYRWVFEQVSARTLTGRRG